MVEHDKGKKVALVNLDNNSYSGIWTPICFTGISPKSFSKDYNGAQLKRVTLYPSGDIKIEYKNNKANEWMGVESDISSLEYDVEYGWKCCSVVVDLWLQVIERERISEEQLEHFKELFLAILLVEHSKGKKVPTFRPQNYKGVWTPLWFAGIPPKFFSGEYNGEHLRRVTLHPDGSVKIAYVGEKPETWL